MNRFFLTLAFCMMTMASCSPSGNAPDNIQEEPYNRELKYSYAKAEDGIEMEVFLPAEDKNIRAAVIACPGGSYSSHAAHEGAVWAPYFNELGIAFAVLKYTLPAGDPSKPIGDMETALGIFNEMADKWLIDRSKIGVMGFSAGGHLACYAATASDFSSDIRPDFQILLYPVTTMDSGTHAASRTNFMGEGPNSTEIMFYSNELWVTPDTPKAFISYAKDETVVPPASNGKKFYDAMIKVGAEAVLLPLDGNKHGWHHDNADHVTKYLNPLKAQLTPWLQNL